MNYVRCLKPCTISFGATPLTLSPAVTTSAPYAPVEGSRVVISQCVSLHGFLLYVFLFATNIIAILFIHVANFFCRKFSRMVSCSTSLKQNVQMKCPKIIRYLQPSCLHNFTSPSIPISITLNK